MKGNVWLYSVVATLSIAVIGCNKAKPIGPTTEYYGVKIDWPRLDELTNCGPDAVAGVYMIKRSIRYEMFPQAMVELDKLSSNPQLNDQQKKLVSDLMDQTKQVLAKAPPRPGQ